MANNEITLKISIDDNGDFKVVATEAKKTAKAVDGVTNATNDLNAATKRAGKTRNNYSKQEKAIHQGSLSAGKGFAAQARTIDGGGGTSLVGAYATLAASIFAITAAFGVLKRAAAFKQLEAGLIATGNAAGTNLPIVAEGLREITGEAISLKEAMTSVALGVSAGFSTTQMEGLTKVAKGASLALGRDMADAMSRLTRGAAKLEPEILDELGIMVRLDTATQGYADSIGKVVGDLSQFERRMAFTNAIIAQGEEKFSLITKSIEANPFDKLSATFSDLTQSVLEWGLVLSPIVGMLADSPTALLGVLIMFASTLIKRIVPAIGEVAKAQSDMAENASKTMKNALTKQSKMVQTMGKNLPSFDMAPKGVKKMEAAIRKGTASSKEMNKAVIKLNTSIKLRTKNLSDEQQLIRKWDTKQLTRHKDELKRLETLRRKLIEVGKARKGESAGPLGGLAGKADRAKTTSKLSGYTAGALTQMEGKGIADSFKIAAGATKLASKEFATSVGWFSKIAAGSKIAGVAVRLLGTAFLTAIPIIGQVIAGLSLLWSFISPWFEAKGIAKAVDEVTESFESLDGIGTQLAATLEFSNTALEKYVATLKVTVGALGLLENGLAKIKEARDKEITPELMESYRKLRELRKAYIDVGGPSNAGAEAEEDYLERRIATLKEQRGQFDIDSANAASEVVNKFRDEANASGTLSAEMIKRLGELEASISTGAGEDAVNTWVKLNKAMKAISGPTATLKGNFESVKDSATGLNNAINKLGSKVENPFKDILSSLAEFEAGITTAKDADLDGFNGTNNLKLYSEELDRVQPKLHQLFQTLGGGDLSKGIILARDKMKEYGETILLANTRARTQGFIMASLRSTAKTNADDAQKYAEASNQKIIEEVRGLQAQLDSKKMMNATDVERLAITAQIAAKEMGIVNALQTRAAVNKKNAIDEQKAILKTAQATLKVLEGKKQIVAQESKMLAAQKASLTIASEMSKELAIQANLLGGGSGVSSAAEELRLFNEQKEARKELLIDETNMKLKMNDAEYELLKQRLVVANQELVIKAKTMEDQGLGSKLIEESKANSKIYLGLLGDVQKMTRQAILDQEDLNLQRMDNKGLKLAYKALQENTKITQENKKLVLDAIKAELDGRSKLLNMVSAQADAQATLAVELAKNRNLRAGGDGVVSAKAELAIFEKQRDARKKIAEDERDLKVAMIDLEYALLEFKLQVIDAEFKNKVSDAPAGRKAEIAANAPDTVAILAAATKVQDMTRDLLKTEEEIREVREDNTWMTLQLKAKKELEDKNQKALAWAQKQLTLQQRILEAIKEQQQLEASQNLEEAKLESFASGTGGAISAQKELELFQQQKEQREEMLEKERSMKLMLIEIEYTLLQAQIDFAEREALKGFADMPANNPMEIDTKETAISGVQNEFEAYKTGLAEAEGYARSIAELAFNTDKMSAFNQELALANAASRDLYSNLSEAFNVIDSPGIAQIGQSIVEAFGGTSEILDNRKAMEAELVSLRKEGLAQQAAAATAGIKGDTKREKKALDSYAAINKKADGKQQALDKSAGAAKMNMAATVANGIGGVLEGLAATQDTSSKSGFESAKKMQYAAAIVNTAGAIAAANAIGPPGNVPAMAFAAAAGAIQIATIASTSFDGGGGAPAAASGGGGGMGSGTGGSSVAASEVGTNTPETESMWDRRTVESLNALADAAEGAAWRLSGMITDISSVGDLWTKDYKTYTTLIREMQSVQDSVGSRSGKNWGANWDYQSGSLQDANLDSKALGTDVDDLEQAIVNKLTEFDKIVLVAAKAFGETWDPSLIQSGVGGFGFDLDKIMRTEYQAQITDFFNRYANAAAESIPGLSSLSEFGDVAFEKLLELAQSIGAVNNEWSKLGLNPLLEGIEGAAIASSFVELMGGTENFHDAMVAYGEIVLTESERTVAALADAKDNIQFIAKDIATTAASDTDVSSSSFDFVQDFLNSGDINQEDFSVIAERLRTMGAENSDLGSLARTIWSELVTNLDVFDLIFEDAVLAAEKAADNLKTLNGLEIELMEAQGFSYAALQAERALELAELEKLEGQYATLVVETQKAVWAQEDANAKFGLQIELMKKVGLGEEALRLERLKTLQAMDPELHAIQLAIFAADDLKVKEQELARERTEAIKVLDRAYKAETKVITDAWKERSKLLKEEISAVEGNISTLTSAIDSLTAAGDSMDKVSKASIKAAQVELKVIKEKVKAGDYEALKDMDDPMSLLTQDNSGLYSSFQEYSLAQAQTRAAIENLKNEAVDSLTTEEETLVVLKDNFLTEEEAHKEVLENMKLEYEAIKGLNNDIVSWELAKAGVAKADVAVAANQFAISMSEAVLQTSLLTGGKADSGTANNLLGGMSESLLGLSWLETMDSSLLSLIGLLSKPLAVTLPVEPEPAPAPAPAPPPASAPTPPAASVTEPPPPSTIEQEVYVPDGGSYTETVPNPAYNYYNSADAADLRAAANDPNASFGSDPSYVDPWEGSGLKGDAFASGGNHAGGMRLVGEQGPELEYTGPSKIYSNPDTKSFFDTSKLENEMKELRKELKEAQEEMVKYSKDTAKVLSRWDGDGMPVERVV